MIVEHILIINAYILLVIRVVINTNPIVKCITPFCKIYHITKYDLTFREGAHRGIPKL